MNEPMSAPKANYEVLERYAITVDGATVYSEIRKDGFEIKYYLLVPKIAVATNALLNEIRNDLVSLTNISMKELTDPEAFLTIKDKFNRYKRKYYYHKKIRKRSIHNGGLNKK